MGCGLITTIQGPRNACVYRNMVDGVCCPAMGPSQLSLCGIPSPQTERRTDRVAGKKRLSSEQMTPTLDDEARLCKRPATCLAARAPHRTRGTWLLGKVEEAAGKLRLVVESIVKRDGLNAVTMSSLREPVALPDVYGTSKPAQIINLAVVGIGSIAVKSHLPAICGSDDFKLTAVVDSKREVLKDLSGLDKSMQAAQNFSSLEALLENSECCGKIQAISVSTPPQGRFSLVAQAIAAGKHVMMEKPPVACVSQLMQLEALARKHRVSLYTSWHSRAMPAVLPARMWLAGKRVLSAKVTWKEDVRWFHRGQSWIWEAGGLGVFDAGINALSILTHLLETLVHVESAVLSIPANVSTPIAANVVLRTAEEAVINCEFDWTVSGQEQAWDIEIQTDHGLLRMRQGGQVLIIDDEDQKVTHDGWQEYAMLYSEFASLIRKGKSSVDARPLSLVSDIFLIGERRNIPAFL